MTSGHTASWADHPELVPFYTTRRNRPEDLYPSETRFFPWLAACPGAGAVLDVGCGAGGFSEIWRHYRPSVVYAGTDISPALIAAARQRYPELEFREGNCVKGLPFPDECAEVVQALGWLHWEPRYRDAIDELWRLTARYLFFDVRLAAKPGGKARGIQRLALIGPWDGETTIPYQTLDWSAFAAFLQSLDPVALFGYGYLGRPSKTVVGIEGDICFATFVLEKGVADPGRRTMVCVDLPLDWPAAQSDRVDLRPSSELATLVPVGEPR
ncbi:MAG: class I SAM-dependent methyltransferase [Gemmatimonadetes bacterium]|nr:class I SAM-dependent methyltransferase [Gemmatimonadota bacterium]